MMVLRQRDAYTAIVLVFETLLRNDSGGVRDLNIAESSQTSSFTSTRTINAKQEQLAFAKWLIYPL